MLLLVAGSDPHPPRQHPGRRCLTRSRLPTLRSTKRTSRRLRPGRPATSAAASSRRCARSTGCRDRRLVEAMRTLDRLPRPRGPRAPGNHWPQHRLEWARPARPVRAARGGATRAGRAPASRSSRCGPAASPSTGWTARSNGCACYARSAPIWLLVATLWAHRSGPGGRSLRALCRERGWTPQTFHNRKTRALTAIAAALETRGEPVF